MIRRQSTGTVRRRGEVDVIVLLDIQLFADVIL